MDPVAAKLPEGDGPELGRAAIDVEAVLRLAEHIHDGVTIT